MAYNNEPPYETTNAPISASYERFLAFERLMKMYSPSSFESFNPTPLGLCAFSLTIFIFSMYNAGVAVPITTSHSVLMGLAFFYGGLIQLLAGLLEFRVRNNFYALAFCSYGGFWFGIVSFYSTFSSNMDQSTENKAFGIFFLAWTIFTASMFISSLRTNLILIFFFFFLTITFILLTVYKFQQGDLNLQRAAGAFGILTAAIGWYAAFASLLKRNENSYFSLPVYNLSPQIPLIIVDQSSTDIRTHKL